MKKNTVKILTIVTTLIVLSAPMLYAATCADFYDHLCGSVPDEQGTDEECGDYYTYNDPAYTSGCVDGQSEGFDGGCGNEQTVDCTYYWFTIYELCSPEQGTGTSGSATVKTPQGESCYSG